MSHRCWRESRRRRVFCTKNTTPAASKLCCAGEVPVGNTASKLISWKSLRGYLGRQPFESPPAATQGAVIPRERLKLAVRSQEQRFLSSPRPHSPFLASPNLSHQHRHRAATQTSPVASPIPESSLQTWEKNINKFVSIIMHRALSALSLQRYPCSYNSFQNHKAPPHPKASPPV